MKQLAWKIRVVLLWVFLAVNYTALLFIEAANGIFTFPTNVSSAQYVIAVFYFIPCLMAWLSLVLAPANSRWPNIVIALLFFILKALGAASIIAPASPGMAINESIASILAALIIWYSWKIPAEDSNERRT